MAKRKDHESFECDNEECGHVLEHWHPVCPKCRKGRMYVQVSETRKLKKDPSEPYVEIDDEN